MIRLADEADFARIITSESELRICALKQAYGLNVPFIRFFADDEGSLASIMDGVCTVHCRKETNDEWCAFLRMYPDIRIIHSEVRLIAVLAEEYRLSYTKGDVLRLDDMSSRSPLHAKGRCDISLREVYALLSTVFEDMPPFEGWYVDASHRVRHGFCHLTAVMAGKQMISSAMTVAETNDVALIGGVATLPDYRGRGAASKCVTELIKSLVQRTILIAPRNEGAARLYKKLGFVPWGTWAELTLP